MSRLLAGLVRPLSRLDPRQRRVLAAAVLGNVLLVALVAAWIIRARMPVDPAAGPRQATLCDVMQVRVQPRVAHTGHEPAPEKPEGNGPSPGGLVCGLSRSLTR